MGLEIELGLPFSHYRVFSDGTIEGIFEGKGQQQVVSFESSRIVTEYEIPSIDSIIDSLDDEAIESVKDALKDMISQMEERNEAAQVSFSDDGILPEFDGEWYCP